MSEKARAWPRPRGPLDWLRTYSLPVLVLLVGAPITTYAVIRSLAWVDTPFPGFLLMENAVVPSVSGYRWPADKAALFHSQVVAVDGTPVSSSGEVYRYVAARPVGTRFAYTFRKDHQLLQRTLPSLAFSVADYLQVYAILLLIGCLSLTVGAVVGFMQPRRTQARVYLLLSFVGNIYATTAVFLHQPDFPLFTRIYFIVESCFPATLIHLALVMFAFEPPLRGIHHLWAALPYAVSALLAASVLTGFFHDPPTLAAVHVTYAYFGASFLFFCGAMVLAYRQKRDARTRLRVKAILPSSVLAVALAVPVLANNALSGGDFPMQLGLLLVPAFYVSVAYAIAKHDLFDIDRVVRQSFVYGLLSIIVISGYAAVLLIPARFIPSFAASDNQALVGMGFVLVLAFALDPLRHAVQSIVDRAFYRTRLDYRATIGKLSEVMTTLLDLSQVVTQVTRVVTDAMHLESTTFCLLGEDGGRSTLWSRGTNGALRERDADTGPELLAQVCERFPQEFNAGTIPERIDDRNARELARTFLTETHASTVLPLVFRGRPIGLLMLGQKRSGQPLASDDIDLLRTLTNQTAIAVQNARSYRALEDLTHTLDEKVRQQTEELRASNEQLSRAYQDLKHAESQLVQSEKMASLGQLVAGVAHELNNPVSFVYGGLANLADYVNGFIEVIQAYERVAIGDQQLAAHVDVVRARRRLDYLLRETPELLRICYEGSERIKKIVDDLRVFARADRGDRVLTDVTEGIDSTIRLLGDRVNRLGVAVVKAYQAVSPVEAQGGLLNQVWMNLLGNAVDAVEGRPQPSIRVAVRPCDPAGPSADGKAPWVEVEIADNGVGIEPEHLQNIFEPFFTTKAIGRGTGLGLSIAYGAVKGHGGTISVQSHPGQGTTVTVRLPAVPGKDTESLPAQPTASTSAAS